MCRWLALLLWLSLTLPVAAQSRALFKIHDAQLGMPAGPFSSEVDEDGKKRPLFKAGVWAPVYVDIECLDKMQEPLELVVESADSDDLTTSYRVPFPTMSPGERIVGGELPCLSYIKPGSYTATLGVSIREVRTGRNVCQPFSRTHYGSQPGKFFVLTAGVKLPGMRFTQPRENPNQPQDDASLLDFGKIEVASIERLRDLPDVWFGYDAANMLIIPTGTDDANFVQEWFSPANDTRWKAVREWVRRGGHLVISVGSNVDTVAGLKELQEMLPTTLVAGSKQSEPTLKLVWEPRGSTRQDHLLRASSDGKAVLSYVTLPDKAGRSSTSLMKMDDNHPKAGQSLIRTGAYGLGKVTVVGFDLEKRPFTDWKTPKEFWQWLTSEAGGRLPPGEDPNANNPSGNMGNDSSDKQLTRIQNTLDFFEGVPVISFGWVALFIVIYIIIIGPLDYYLLKKVFKRMELTWITFPVVVIGISAAAYFTAYAMKGKDLKINKIDLIDIDLQTQRVYGNTWFSVFSPRIQNYDVAVEPNNGGWTAEPIAIKSANTLMAWTGEARNNRQSLFVRDYRFHVDTTRPDGEQQFASGLERVPIQVWSTKSFVGEWVTRIDAENPLVVSTLRLTDAKSELPVGTIQLNLPMPKLDDVQLFYRNQRYDLGTLASGVAKRFVGNNPQEVQKWLRDNTPEDNQDPYNNRYRTGEPIAFRLWGTMFHDAFDSSGTSIANGSLRRLDQSWRLSRDNIGEAILIGRIPTVVGQAEELMEPSDSPTRLWLMELPGSGERTPIVGTLRQETYVRVLIPILR